MFKSLEFYVLMFSSHLSTFHGSVNNALFLGVQNAIFSASLMFFYRSSADKIDFVIYFHVMLLSINCLHDY